MHKLIVTLLERFVSAATSRVHTVEFQWLQHLGNHENMFETRVVRANEC